MNAKPTAAAASTTPTTNESKGISRRTLIARTGQIAAAGALAGIAVPHVYAAGNSTVQIALIGCGGRGTGAAGDALRSNGVRPKLIAMADAYKDRLDNSFKALTNDEFVDKVEVTDERKFIGFDAYKHAMDALSPGDVAIFATPLAFRPVHFAYAIEKKLNVFMEKPLCADGASGRKLLELGEEASKKNLKVGVGLMSRHHRPLEQLAKRIADGEIGDVMMMRGYRVHGPVASFRSPPKPKNLTEVEYQIRRFHSFLWASGGCFSDFNIHIIDHLCWMKNDWPVSALGFGGRHFKADDNGVPWVDQNFDSYSVEYTFKDGTKMFFDGRCMDGTYNQYTSVVQGTKGAAVASSQGDCGAPSSTYKGQVISPDNRIWQSTDRTNPYQNEWNDLMSAIANDKPYNEVARGVKGSLVTSMGRMSAHSGQLVTYENMLNDGQVFAPNVDKITNDGPAPVMPDKNGMYPQPQPGKKQGKEKFFEY